MIEMIKGGLIGLVIGTILAGAGGWWVRGYEVKSLQTELKVERDANAANQATIGALKQEVQKAAKSCNARIDSKDRTLKRLKMIEDLKGGSDEKYGNGSADPLLGELNRMRKPAVGKD